MITRSQARKTSEAMEVEDLALRPKASTHTAVNVDGISNSKRMTKTITSSPNRKRKASEWDENQVLSSISITDNEPRSAANEMFGIHNEATLLLDHLRNHNTPTSTVEPEPAKTSQTEALLAERSPPPARPAQLTEQWAAIEQRDNLAEVSRHHGEALDVASREADTLKGNTDDDETSGRASSPRSADVPADNIVRDQEPTQSADHILAPGGEEGRTVSTHTRVQGATIRIHGGSPEVLRSSSSRLSREIYQNASARPIGSYASFRDKVIGKENRVLT